MPASTLRVPGLLVAVTTTQRENRSPSPIVCESRDSNPDAVRRQILSLLRLPVPPLPLMRASYRIRRREVSRGRLSVIGRPREASKRQGVRVDSTLTPARSRY